MDWKPKMEQQLLEIEKKESKKLKKLSKVTRVDEPEALLESEQAKPEQFKQKKCIYQETDQLYMKILVYLDNPYEEAIYKQQHEIVKLLNEEARMLQQKHLKL